MWYNIGGIKFQTSWVQSSPPNDVKYLRILWSFQDEVRIDPINPFFTARIKSSQILKTGQPDEGGQTQQYLELAAYMETQFTKICSEDVPGIMLIRIRYVLSRNKEKTFTLFLAWLAFNVIFTPKTFVQAPLPYFRNDPAIMPIFSSLGGDIATFKGPNEN